MHDDADLGENLGVDAAVPDRRLDRDQRLGRGAALGEGFGIGRLQRPVAGRQPNRFFEPGERLFVLVAGAIDPRGSEKGAGDDGGVEARTAPLEHGLEFAEGLRGETLPEVQPGPPQQDFAPLAAPGASVGDLEKGSRVSRLARGYRGAREEKMGAGVPRLLGDDFAEHRDRVCDGAVVEKRFRLGDPCSRSTNRAHARRGWRRQQAAKRQEPSRGRSGRAPP